jgi:hypothetical protein
MPRWLEQRHILSTLQTAELLPDARSSFAKRLLSHHKTRPITEKDTLGTIAGGSQN